MCLHPTLIQHCFTLVERIHLPHLLDVVSLILVVDELGHVTTISIRVCLLRVRTEIVGGDTESSLFVGCITHHLIFKLFKSLIFGLIFNCSLIVRVPSIPTLLKFIYDSELSIV